MSKNYMEKVAKMLGLELGETFKVVGGKGAEQYFKFSEKGIRVSYDGVHWCKGTVTTVLEDIMAGRVRVATLPWKPKIDESYYIPVIPYVRSVCEEHHWKDTEAEKKYYDMGLVFKTGEEAVALARRMLAVAKEEKEK